jgi:ribosome-associated protein
MNILKMQKAAVEALEDIKARDIMVLKVDHMTSMFERVIIATADSTRQVKALAENVQEKLKALGARVHGVEGLDSGEWVLVDMGEIVVHVMQPAVRQHYNLEELWDHPARKKRATTKKAVAFVAT